MTRDEVFQAMIKDLEEAILSFEFVQNEIMPLAAQGKLDGFEDKIQGVQRRLAESLDKAHRVMSGPQEHDELSRTAMERFGTASIWYNSAIAGMMLGRQQILGKGDVQFSRALKETYKMQEDAVSKVKAAQAQTSESKEG